MRYSERARDGYLKNRAAKAHISTTVNQKNKFKIDEGDGFPSWMRVEQFMKSKARV